jgi:DNA repair protein RecO (recombination protein O)
VGKTEVRDALVLRRHPLPSGDVIATLLSPDGRWRAIARKGKLPGGNLARLSLFHDVTVQVYHRRSDDLALITQVRLNGALAGLSKPEVYGYAHLLAELTDHLTTEHPADEQHYTLLTSALRGLNVHHDPEAVALAYSWRLLRHAGLAPQVSRCSCGAPPDRLLIAEGMGLCSSCAQQGAAVGFGPEGAQGALVVGEAAMAALDFMLRAPLREVMATPPSERDPQWRALRRFIGWHLGKVRALEVLPP